MAPGVAIALRRHSWRRFVRGHGNPFTLLVAVGAVAASDYLAARAAPGLQAVLGAAGVRALFEAWVPLLLGALCAQLAWSRLFGRREEAELLAGQPIPAAPLYDVWFAELLLAAALPAAIAAAAAHRLTGAWELAVLPLLALPSLVAIGVAIALVSARLGPRSRTALAFLGLTLPIAGVVGTTLALRRGIVLPASPPGMLVAVVVICDIALTALVRDRFAERWRARLAGVRRAGASRRSGRGSALVLAFLPRQLRALLLADLRFLLRGGHPLAAATVPLLLALPLAYLVWPLPPDVAQAPLLVGGMISTFALVCLGHVLGAELGQAQKPYLALRRTAPVEPGVSWWARMILVTGVGVLFALIFAAVLVARHGPEGLRWWTPIAALGLFVPAYAAALGLAVDTADVEAAGSIAGSAIVVAVLLLLIVNAFPPLGLLFPILLRGPYRAAIGRYRAELA